MKYSIWRYFLLLIVSVLLITPTRAQRHQGNIVRVEAGPSLLDLEVLNQSLNTRFFETLPQTFFAVGLSAEHFQNRLVFGGQIYNFMLGRSAQISPRALLGFQHIQLQAGFVAARGENWTLYPTVGAGGGMATFKAFLQNQQAPEVTREFGLLGHAALHFRHRMELDEKYIYELGISGGYTRTLTGAWTLDQFAADLDGIPMSPEGLFFRVSIGMGSWK
ncbi:MAG: hypothetical protein AAFV07_16975 [Bacteroidota bacterium]